MLRLLILCIIVDQPTIWLIRLQRGSYNIQTWLFIMNEYSVFYVLKKKKNH